MKVKFKHTLILFFRFRSYQLVALSMYVDDLDGRIVSVSAVQF